MYWSLTVLQVIEKATNYSPDMTRGVIVIESDLGQGKFPEAMEELSGNEAKHFALNTVAHMGLTHINGNIIGPYPGNSNGTVLGSDADAALPPTHPDRQPHRYRIDVPVTRKF